MTPANLLPRNLAYLTTAYPSVSHTFIRREILGLEKLGYSIHRFAIRPGTISGDPQDIAEEQRTTHLLSLPIAQLALHCLRGFFGGRGRALAALAVSIGLSRASERGLLRHFGYWLEALALNSLFAARGIGHVHVHFGTNASAVAMLVHHMGGPGFSMTIHGPDEFDAAIGLSLAKKIHAARFTVAISNYCSAQLRRWANPEDWSRIHVVRCTVEETWFDAAMPMEDTASTLVAIGRLSAQKGHALLLDAFAEAVNRGMEGTLVLVGDGELRELLQSRINALGLGQRVLLTGWATEAKVRDTLMQSRALVLASFAEGLPMVLMEAMALQRPVIASTIAGVPELVRDGKDGWLVAAGDQEHLVTALLAASRATTEQLRSMGRRGQDQVRTLHSTSIETAKLDSLIRAHLEPAPSPH